MPFKSKGQVRYMFSQHPKIAKEFAEKTPSIKALPNKVHQVKALKSLTPKGLSTKK